MSKKFTFLRPDLSPEELPEVSWSNWIIYTLEQTGEYIYEPVRNEYGEIQLFSSQDVDLVLFIRSDRRVRDVAIAIGFYYDVSRCQTLRLFPIEVGLGRSDVLPIIGINLAGLDEAEAAHRLLTDLFDDSGSRSKPAEKPVFPGDAQSTALKQQGSPGIMIEPGSAVYQKPYPGMQGECLRCHSIIGWEDGCAYEVWIRQPDHGEPPSQNGWTIPCPHDGNPVYIKLPKREPGSCWNQNLHRNTTGGNKE